MRSQIGAAVAQLSGDEMTLRVSSVQRASKPDATYINGVDWSVTLTDSERPMAGITIKLSKFYTDAEMREIVRRIDPGF